MLLIFKQISFYYIELTLTLGISLVEPGPVQRSNQTAFTFLKLLNVYIPPIYPQNRSFPKSPCQNIEKSKFLYFIAKLKPKVECGIALAI